VGYSVVKVARDSIGMKFISDINIYFKVGIAASSTNRACPLFKEEQASHQPVFVDSASDAREGSNHAAVESTSSIYLT
jgi:hypothetical protein